MRLKRRDQAHVLREVPLIAEVEGMMGIRGIEWRAEFDARCDRVSLALFGITAADTLRPEPHPDQFGNGRGASRLRMEEGDLAAYSRALDEWHRWEAVLIVPTIDAHGPREFNRRWRALGFNVLGSDGQPLRCLHRFARQLVVIAKKLLPNATLTLDGSGRRGAQDAEAWGAALAAEAACFKTRRSAR